MDLLLYYVVVCNQVVDFVSIFSMREQVDEHPYLITLYDQ